MTIDELQTLMRDANLQNVRVKNYKMEMELETHLAASFPNAGDDEKIRRLFREDIGLDNLGVGAHWRGEKIYYAYPVTVIVGEKAS